MRSASIVVFAIRIDEKPNQGRTINPMTEYRRPRILGATWFFTVNLAQRQGNHLLVNQIDRLRNAIQKVKAGHPFAIDAVGLDKGGLLPGYRSG